MLDEEQHRYLKQEAKAQKLSISEVVRQLLDREMRKIAYAQADGAGIIAEHASSGPETEIHHDEVLYR